MPPQHVAWHLSHAASDSLALPLPTTLALEQYVTPAAVTGLVSLAVLVVVILQCVNSPCARKSSSQQPASQSTAGGGGDGPDSVPLQAQETHAGVAESALDSSDAALMQHAVASADASAHLGDATQTSVGSEHLPLDERAGVSSGRTPSNVNATPGADQAGLGSGVSSPNAVLRLLGGNQYPVNAKSLHGAETAGDGSSQKPIILSEPLTSPPHEVGAAQENDLRGRNEGEKVSTGQPSPGAHSETLDRGRSHSEPVLDSPSFTWPESFGLPGPGGDVPSSAAGRKDSASNARGSHDSVGRYDRSASTEPLEQPPAVTLCTRSLSFQLKPGRDVVPRIGGRRARPALSLSLNPISSQDLPAENKELLTLEKLTSPMSQEELLARNIDTELAFLRKEFWAIPMNQPDRAVACSGPKNRYPTIFPNIDTRVFLPLRGIDVNTTYINANYISGYKSKKKDYIATQGPLTNTFADFWRMVWQESSEIVVNMTLMDENSKRKCDRYWPGSFDGDLGNGEGCAQDVGARCAYDVFTVLIEECRLVSNTYAYSKLRLDNSESGGGESRCVHHFWYVSWPDQGVPESPQQLLDFLEEVRQVRASDGPMVVHCSAGIGRTGCFSAVDIGSQQLQEQNSVDVQQIVASLRKDRGGMVQNCEQYIFLFHCFQLIARQQLASRAAQQQVH